MTTSRQMVLVAPNHAKTMTRDQLEAHFNLLGWRPTCDQCGGAIKDDLSVFVYHDVPDGNKVVTSKWGDTVTRMIATRAADIWFMSHDTFQLLANMIMEIEACQHESIRSADGKKTGIPMRCTVCCQLVDC